jgi:hypothetical protein
MAIAPSEGPGLPMYKTYYESAPGVIRSTGNQQFRDFGTPPTALACGVNLTFGVNQGQVTGLWEAGSPCNQKVEWK